MNNVVIKVTVFFFHGGLLEEYHHYSYSFISQELES